MDKRLVKFSNFHTFIFIHLSIYISTFATNKKMHDIYVTNIN